MTDNKAPIPLFMYGTAWKKQNTARLVELAVRFGFRAIDTANQMKHYDEALVGEALQAVKQLGVRRDDLFIQTKFTPLDGQDQRLPYDARADLTTQVKQSFDSSLKHLHVEHIDSYVLHGPYGRYDLSASDWQVWAAMEALYEAGKAKMIGISNVSAQQLSQLCAKPKVKPMVVQNRCYASTGWDKEVRTICRTNNIIYQGFSLLTANPKVLSRPEVRAIAARLHCNAPQVIFRFALQAGMLPLTGTTNAEHMKEDLLIEQYSLSEAEMSTLENQTS